MRLLRARRPRPPPRRTTLTDQASNLIVTYHYNDANQIRARKRLIVTLSCSF